MNRYLLNDYSKHIINPMGLSGVLSDLPFAIGQRVVVNGHSYVVREVQTLTIKYFNTTRSFRIEHGFSFISGDYKVKHFINSLGFANSRNFLDAFFLNPEFLEGVAQIKVSFNKFSFFDVFA